jgi:NAD(P)-dependent dehydrogenase (short-subunit alcohol dehydrogenase family)
MSPSDNPVALITGASRGIGRGIALALAALGYDLGINYVSNAAAARQTASDCAAAATATGRRCRALPCPADISQATDRERLVGQLREEFGRLDLLVNNAGVAPAQRTDLLDTTEESLDRLLAINLKGPFLLTQQVARWMVEQLPGRPPGGPQPKIITITSISAYTASVNRGDYCVSKAGLAMLTPLFASRLAEHGIQVFELRPGIIRSDMTAGVAGRYDRLLESGFTPINRWGTPEDVGRAVAAIASDAFPFSTGEVFNIDGGFHLRRL